MKLKDKPLPPEVQYKFIYPIQSNQSNSPTYRDVLIDIAADLRERDVDYFVRKAFQDYYDPNAINVITDWRYPNEFEYVKRTFTDVLIITASIFRSEAPIPDESIFSEHQLDDFPVSLSIFPYNDDKLKNLRFFDFIP
jgi:hypothetical protein